jgi:hypothetical protein
MVIGLSESYLGCIACLCIRYKLELDREGSLFLAKREDKGVMIGLLVTLPSKGQF